MQRDTAPKTSYKCVVFYGDKVRLKGKAIRRILLRFRHKNECISISDAFVFVSRFSPVARCGKLCRINQIELPWNNSNDACRWLRRTIAKATKKPAEIVVHSGTVEFRAEIGSLRTH
jgi:hypothetical protein